MGVGCSHLGEVESIMGAGVPTIGDGLAERSAALPEPGVRGRVIAGRVRHRGTGGRAGRRVTARTNAMPGHRGGTGDPARARTPPTTQREPGTQIAHDPARAGRAA